MGVALWESVAPAMTTHESFAGKLKDLSAVPSFEEKDEYHMPTVVNAALAYMTKKLFINTSVPNKSKIRSMEKRFAKEFKGAVSKESYKDSVEYGRLIAKHIYKWSRGDGGKKGDLNNFPDSYTFPKGKGLWVETAPEMKGALHPHWGGNRTFVLDAASECLPGPHPEYSEEPKIDRC